MVQTRYGSPDDVLVLRDVEEPAIAADEVLVRVRAASVHPDVWHVVTGAPYLLRLMGAGLMKPKTRIPGTDAAGHVQSIGKDVTRFRPGDAVFGETVRGHQWHNGGAYAEYVSVREEALALKPDNLSFEQAAALPTSGLIALQGLRSEGYLESGQRVLVNGAGGGVGALAVQLAKAFGAEVTAVDSAEKLEMLESIGADYVVDYALEDFTKSGNRYDLILDIPGNRSFSDLRRGLADEGRYVLIGHERFGDSGARWVGNTMVRIVKLLFLRPFGSQAKGEQSLTEANEPLVVLRDLAEAGKLAPVVDKTWPLDGVPEALRYLVDGHAKGKVVITP